MALVSAAHAVSPSLNLAPLFLLLRLVFVFVFLLQQAAPVQGWGTATTPTVFPVSQLSDGQPQAPTHGSSYTASSSTAPPTCLPYVRPQLRFPPQLSIAQAAPAWTAPPPGWIFGNWRVTYSSRPVYHTFVNLQGDVYPVLPQTANMSYASIGAVQADVTSFNLLANASDPRVYTAFGYDTLIAPAEYRFAGTGVLATTTNVYALLAWGYDSAGAAYRVDYETPYPGNPACINFDSRLPSGPSPDTVRDLFAAMERLYAGYPDLLALLPNITSLPRDARRDGLGPAVCDAACIANTDLV